jgi:hypothetical protein
MGQYLRAVWKGGINIFNVWLGFDLYLLFHSGDGKPFGWFFFPRPSRILVKQFGDEKGFLIFGHTRLYFSISEVPGLLAIWSLRFVCSIGCMLPFWLALTFQDRGKLRRQGDILNSWPIYWRVSNIHICFGSLVILFVTKPRMAISHDSPFSTHSVAPVPRADSQQLTSSSWVCASSWTASQIIRSGNRSGTTAVPHPGSIPVWRILSLPLIHTLLYDIIRIY